MKASKFDLAVYFGLGSLIGFLFGLGLGARFFGERVVAVFLLAFGSAALLGIVAALLKENFLDWLPRRWRF